MICRLLSHNHATCITKLCAINLTLLKQKIKKLNYTENKKGTTFSCFDYITKLKSYIAYNESIQSTKL